MTTLEAKPRALIVLILLVATLLGACATQEPKPVVNLRPTFSERLDNLYASDRRGWRDEMQASIRAGRRDIPARHLALALESFNDERHRELFMEAAGLYLDARQSNAPRFSSAADRRLFNFYAESALRSSSGPYRRRLEDLCLTLVQEPVCSSG